MPSAATVLAIAAISLPSLPKIDLPFLGKGKPDQPPRVQHLKPAKGWRLTVRTDRFTGEKACQLRARDTLYQDGLVTFRFDHQVDTANAEFRVGEGPVRSVGEVAVAAAGLGARFLTSNSRNPSDGAVRIPARELTAQSITIRPNPKAKPRRFSLVGFDRSLSIARERGCA